MARTSINMSPNSLSPPPQTASGSSPPSTSLGACARLGLGSVPHLLLVVSVRILSFPFVHSPLLTALICSGNHRILRPRRSIQHDQQPHGRHHPGDAYPFAASVLRRNNLYVSRPNHSIRPWGISVHCQGEMAY